jgi:transcriptional regulator with XRE-family HTH domain
MEAGRPDLAETLRSARTSRGVSQSALARRTGIPQPAISRIEAGHEVPSLERFGRLIAGLGLRLDLGLEPLATHRGDPRHREAVRRMTPGERLEQAAGWSGFAGALRGQARG